MELPRANIRFLAFNCKWIVAKLQSMINKQARCTVYNGQHRQNLFSSATTYHKAVLAFNNIYILDYNFYSKFNH